MSQEVEAALRAQYDLYGRIARANENLMKAGAANITTGMVEARLRALEANWTKFEARHDNLMATHRESVIGHDYHTKELFAVMEETYLKQKGAFLDVLMSIQLKVNGEAPAAGSSTAGQSSRTTLPRIQLPQFSGLYEDWPSFRDLFQSLIFKDAATSTVEKFHYLKTCVKGEAELLIRGLPTTGENFDRAWKTLATYYENKRLLVRSYLSRFTELQRLKTESAGELRKLLHNVRNTVSSLESIGRPITAGDDLFVHLIAELLDPRSRRDWESAISDSLDPPSCSAILQFLERRLQTLESLQPVKPELAVAKQHSGAGRHARALHTRGTEKRQGRCSACGHDHYVMFCDAFKAMTPMERRQHVEIKGLCLNCLGRHKVSECSSKKACSRCNARHHTSLHEAVVEVSRVSVNLGRPSAPLPSVLLATARVRVSDCFGVRSVVRALIDQGSEMSLISESLTQRLRLSRASATVSVYGVGGKLTGVARGQVSVDVEAMRGGGSISISALVLPRLSVCHGGVRADGRRWDHLEGLELADPDYLAGDPVDLLLGAEVFAEIVMQGLIRGGPRAPVAQQTALGWILSGRIDEPSIAGSAGVHHCLSDAHLGTLVRRFWEQEEVSTTPALLSPEEQETEDHFARTHSRLADGRYVVRLPIKSPLPPLSTTRTSAAYMLGRMERRFNSDDSFRQLYVAFMREYENLGHMSLIPVSHHREAPTCFLPHHGVLRSQNSRTKLRVVFNGSSAGPGGDNLNRHLQVGPNLLPALADVLLRWRTHRYVLVADVEKMYRQIAVDPADRHLQKILWRYDDRAEMREYALNTVTYGLACAPFLAIRILRQLADDEETQFPLGSTVLRRDVYVDDILTGATTYAEADETRRQLEGICLAGGFPLRKWATNKAELLRGIPLEHRSLQTPLSWHSQECHTTLGLRWHPQEDCFSFATGSVSVPIFTKRSVLSLTARLFDPLGWLAPCVIRAKVLFQSTWLQGLGWDTPLKETELAQWRAFQDDLQRLETIRIPWSVELDAATSAGELHGFADASERAYGAVVYLRTVSGDGETRIRLVTAKTKVAPIKTVSLPRLELCAALLLARLLNHVRRVFDMAASPVHAWSDSTVALGWIGGHPSRWKTYVANRTAEIQAALPDAQWRHLPGAENPADCASRGVSPSELVTHRLWWHGPAWLRCDESEWPSSPGSTTTGGLPEERAGSYAAVERRASQIEEPSELTRFSSLSRLVRAFAWVRRWLQRRHRVRELASLVERSPQAVTLSVAECEASRAMWVRLVQAAHYKAELQVLAQGRTLPSRSPLQSLTPFADSSGVLRVGGRLKHVLLAYDERHPTILPRESHFTRLIVMAHHRRTLHGGVQLTLGSIRQTYWIPRGRQLVRETIRRCVTCVRWRAAPQQQLMSNLPRQRVTPTRPFLHTGVNYAGPIQLRTAKGRRHRAHKAFIAVFVCMSTRAVHIEAVSDYTTEAFLAALRRFTSRRGLCRNLYSDCGTNFVGADAQLRAFFAAGNPGLRRVADQLAGEQIQWHFNPPAAPHFGGLWEAAVKSMKHHLRRVIGDSTLTYEEMSTLLAQIEACLNSRPLQALSDDPEDLAALTPGHFLVGSALSALPEPSHLDTPSNRLSRWQLLQAMRDHFWKRWAQEYLQSIMHRPKWRTKHDNVRIGRLCLLRNESTPPSKWPLARIIQVHAGEDGCIRVVTLRTALTELRRPVSKLVLLPDCSSDAEEKPCKEVRDAQGLPSTGDAGPFETARPRPSPS